jgi:hypothetical protein
MIIYWVRLRVDVVFNGAIFPALQIVNQEILPEHIFNQGRFDRLLPEWNGKWPF